VRVRAIADVASAVRGRRTDLDLSQSALAERTGISRKWISEFEGGKTTAEFALVIRVLEELGFKLDLDLDPSTPAPSASPVTSTADEARTSHPPVDLDALLEEHRRG
jgi:HTH-type transcriptional regulator / antitoxin HipB